jgi:hypothetical protein
MMTVAGRTFTTCARKKVIISTVFFLLIDHILQECSILIYALPTVLQAHVVKESMSTMLVGVNYVPLELIKMLTTELELSHARTAPLGNMEALRV